VVVFYYILVSMVYKDNMDMDMHTNIKELASIGLMWWEIIVGISNIGCFFIFYSFFLRESVLHRILLELYFFCSFQFVCVFVIFGGKI
jgi:hypothetical protein